MDGNAVTTVQRCAFRSAGNGPVPHKRAADRVDGANVMKNASNESSTKQAIEAIRACAFAPPDSPLDRARTMVAYFRLATPRLGIITG
jgi:hypothetical protein